jgi:hypothetical protein
MNDVAKAECFFSGLHSRELQVRGDVCDYSMIIWGATVVFPDVCGIVFGTYVVELKTVSVSQKIQKAAEANSDPHHTYELLTRLLYLEPGYILLYVLSFSSPMRMPDAR